MNVNLFSSSGNVTATVRLSEWAMAAAELTRISDIEGVKYAIATTKKSVPGLTVPERFFNDPIYYFNRLIVPPGYKRQGHGTLLLKSITAYAQSSGFNILNNPSDYKLGMNFTNLVLFYERNKFVRACPEGKTMFYMFRDHQEVPV